MATTEITWDDLKAMLAELIAESKKTEQQVQETGLLIRELRESQKQQMRETERQMRETERQMQETAQQMRETDRRLQETDRRLQETDRRLQETDRLIRELRRDLGRLGNRLGEFVQDMVQPAVVRLFQAQGIPVHVVMPNLCAYSANRERVLEIDLFVVNAEHAIAVECKSRLTTDDVDEHLERLAELKKFLPQYADKKLHGAVAALSVAEPVARYAEKQGLYVLAQADDDVVVMNSPDFTPRTW